ncbi:MAG TPA: TIGR04551 family protein, partial [Myxococcaceae bacterium]|nr:TIGR04551 family protein [Myxococcaceae bacterium]
YETKRFRVELEWAAVLGDIGNSALKAEDAGSPNLNQSLSVTQFGAVAQSEFRFVEGALKVGMEIGFASGDRAPGLGNRPRRLGKGLDGGPLPGDIDGPQYCLNKELCSGSDSSIKNFQFNKEYRIDLILWRELLGGITDAFYFKPSIKYELADGINLFGALIYSRAIFAESTPSGTSNSLGIELNVGARYETEDGFFAQLAYGILFPLGGLENATLTGGVQPPGLDNAQALRGVLGIKF